jgi:hypothetical protein
MAFRFLLVTVLAVLTGSTHAETASDANAPRYAVLSLIGDALTVVTYQASTGSSMDANRHVEILALTRRIATSGAASCRGLGSTWIGSTA